MRTIVTGRSRLKSPAPHKLGALPLSGAAPLLVLSLAAMVLSRSRLVSWLAFLLSGQFSVGGFKRPNGFSVGGFKRPAGFAAVPGDIPSWVGYDTVSEAPSVANLSRSLTIGALTGTPICWYKSQDSTTNLVAEVGTTLTRSGAGTIAYAQGTPLMGSDTAIKGDGTNYFQDSGTTYGNVGTAGQVWTGLIKATGTTSVLFAKRNAGVGYECGIDASDRLYYTVQDAGGATTTVSAALTIGCWYHFSIVAIREGEGTCQIYMQRTASGAAVDISSRSGTLNSATAFTVMADSGAATPYNGSLSYLAGWTFAAGLTQAAALVVLAQRFRALTGCRPQSSTAGVDTAPITAARNCVATLQKYNTTTSAVEYYTVGENWTRVERWLVGSSTVMGIRQELAATNTPFAASSNVTTGWTFDTGTDTTVPADGPWGSGTAEGWIPSATSGTHGRMSSWGPAATTCTWWVVAKPGAFGWIQFRNVTCGITRYFELSSGTTTGTGGTCYTVDLGGGYRLCACVHTSAGQTSYYVRTAEGDGDITLSGDGAAVGTYFAHMQVEAGSIHTSPIMAVGSTTRVKDEFECVAVHPGAQGAICCDVVQANADVATGCYLVDLSDAGATNRASLTQVAAGDAPVALVGSTGSVTGTTDLATLTLRRLGMRWRANQLEQWVNGAQDGAADTTVTAPAAMNQIAIGMGYSNANQPAVPTLIRNIRVYDRWPADMARLTVTT